ncbi:MAG: hypothetical protein K2N28_10800 [Muribaculaceae bacterium]|nr:hypothetical protein [Muribaculaceae bacterium]
MKTRHILLLTLALLAGTFRADATGYDALVKKARLFYTNSEWSSALAMYTLMIEERPAIVDNYSHAIVAASLAGDTRRTMQLLEQSTKARVPLDSLYAGIRTLAFDRGDALIYEQFLKNAAATYPWLKRNIDARLLQYYVWRRDGEGMVQYATIMLNGMPDNVDFLTDLADGYFTLGDNTRAVETYSYLLAIDPDNYHALLVLGNYYHDIAAGDKSDLQSRELAREYLTRAYTLRPTPFLARLLHQ